MVILQLCFNGTIYNHKDLKTFLLKKGVKFKTECDTEVLVNGYSFWGEKVFNYIDGMWAVAIFDKIKKEIVLSRDYLGQKPLYYEMQKKILFSSQLKGIIQDKSFTREIDNESVKIFLLVLKSPSTIYKSVKQVNPSEIIRIKISSLSISRRNFWKLEKGPDYNQFFKKETLNFSSDFEQIIDNYSVSDVMPSGLLSSGLDSFVVNKFLTKKFTNFKTYTLGFEQDSFDEIRNFNKNSKFLIKIF